MQKKLFLLGLIASICSIGFAQKDVEQKDSIAKNLSTINDKAIVYIIRSTEFGFLVKMNIDCDSVHIGSTLAKKYIYTILAAGKHVFTAKSENKFKLEMNLEAGKIYYLQQQVNMGLLYATTKLKILNEEDGKKYLKKCKLSKDNLYSN
jgi:hypothetical protein